MHYLWTLALLAHYRGIFDSLLHQFFIGFSMVLISKYITISHLKAILQKQSFLKCTPGSNDFAGFVKSFYGVLSWDFTMLSEDILTHRLLHKWLGLSHSLWPLVSFNNRFPFQPNLPGYDGAGTFEFHRKQRWEGRMGWQGTTSWSWEGTSWDPCPCRGSSREMRPRLSRRWDQSSSPNYASPAGKQTTFSSCR